jgi:hypothetical protein
MCSKSRSTEDLMSLARRTRLVPRIRPWMVAVALACAGAAPGCSRGAHGTGDAARSRSADARSGAEPPIPTVYGPAPCTPRDLEGPPSCASDEECAARHAAGWYCTPEPLTVDDGCGRRAAWGRVCACCSDAADAAGADRADGEGGDATAAAPGTP